MARLVFRKGTTPRAVVELRSGLNRIGRNPANDVRVEDASVSSFHCEMDVSDLGIVFRDKGSTNGSFVEGRRVSKEVFTSSKLLRLGNLEVEVEIPLAHVAIPDLPKDEQIYANFLADGTQACQRHGEVAATFYCGKCERAWCEQCLRRTGLAGSSRQVVSCLDCGAVCERITISAAPQKRSIFGRLGMLIKK